MSVNEVFADMIEFDFAKLGPAGTAELTPTNRGLNCGSPTNMMDEDLANRSTRMQPDRNRADVAQL